MRLAHPLFSRCPSRACARAHQPRDRPHPGHIGFLVDDLHGLCAAMEAAGVPFKKRPDDGVMKNLAFAIDPSGYWVEMIPRSASAALKGRPSFQQTMLRVKARWPVGRPAVGAAALGPC